MERAGAEDMPEDAERKGLGTPATRAAILEKLGADGLCPEKGQAAHSHQGRHQFGRGAAGGLTSPQLTAEWECCLTEIAKGQADPDEFMAGIEAMMQELIKTYSCISEDKQKLFQTERIAIGTCPRCGEAVYEGRKTTTAETGPASLSCGRMTDFLRNGARRSPRRSPRAAQKTERQR